MTWMLYHQHVDGLGGYAKRRFLTDAEDWPALRLLDTQKMKETDLGVGDL